MHGMLHTLMTHRILIVGGGFGGVTAAQHLAKKNLPDVSITLLTDKPWLEYHSILYRVIAGGHPSESCIPLALVVPSSVTIVRGNMAQTDTVQKTVTTKDSQTLPYDTLILAPGSEPSYFNIPGMQEHSITMKSVEDALALRQHVDDCVTAMVQADASGRAMLGHFVVIGAGPTGIEIAGDIIGSARALARSKGLDPSLIQVDLIEAADRVLPATEPVTSKKVEKRLRAMGVNVLLNTAVSSAEETVVHLKEGQAIETKSIIWTAGVKASTSLSSVTGLTLDKRGRATVDAQLQTMPNVFVLGDCAATPYAGMAQTAIEDGVFAAGVIEAELTGTSLPAYNPTQPAYAIPVGPHWAAVRYKGLHLYGFAGYIMRRAADMESYLLLLPFTRSIQAFFGKIPLKSYGIALTVIGLLFLSGCASGTPTTGSGSPSSSSASSVAMETYTNTSLGYSISYPSTWSVQENQTLAGPDMNESGTVFLPPPSELAGTTLLASQVEVASAPSQCATAQNGTGTTINDMNFERGIWGLVKNGQIVQTVSYATAHNNACYAVIFYNYVCIPSSSNCPAGRITPYSPGPRVRLFEQMVRTLAFH